MTTAMIWGANGGIGRALTQQLTVQGFTVLALARQAERLHGLAQHAIEADVASPYQVELAVTTAAQLVEEVNLWIYAAGDIVSARVAATAATDWERMLNANLTGAFLTTRLSLPLLAANAHLVYLGAVHERLRLPGLSAYAAAKAGLEAFVETLAKEQRQRRVTLVRMGAVATPLWEKVPLRLPATALLPEEVAAQILQAHRQGHQGALEIVAGKQPASVAS